MIGCGAGTQEPRTITIRSMILATQAAEAPAKKAEQAAAPKKSARKAKTSAEKTTLGDITQLQALKDEMEEKENKASKK